VEPANWDEFRVDVISWRTFLKRNLIHQQLLRATLRRARGSVLEVGTGSGAQAALLSRFIPRVVTVDNSERILGVARRNLDRYGRGVLATRGDAFALPFADDSFDVATSQGLVEHFDDAAIGHLVREQLRVCRSVVFSVPSDRYPRQDVGNERLMSPARWLDIIAGAAGGEYRVSAHYIRFDLEAVKYSVLAKRWLGSFAVLVTVDSVRQDDRTTGRQDDRTTGRQDDRKTGRQEDRTADDRCF
jgi:SAM-dependent methyltransferase